MVLDLVFTFKAGICNVVFKVSLSIAVRNLSTKKQISFLPLQRKCAFPEQTQEGAFR